MDLDDPSQALHEGGLHLLRAEEEAVLRHRAGAADLTPPKEKSKENKGSARELETDELGMSFSARSNLSRRQKSTGPMTAPSRAKYLSCCNVRTTQERNPNVLALGGVQSEGPVVQALLEACQKCLRGPVKTTDGLIVKVVMSAGQLVASPCARPSQMASWRPRAKCKNPRESTC